MVLIDKKVQDVVDRYKAACERTGHELKIVHKMICCRRPSCRVCGGTAYAHGPYVYGYYYDIDKKVKLVYIGRVVPLPVIDKKGG